MKKTLNYTASFIVISLLLIACGSKKIRPLNERFSAFLNGNEKIILFGTTNLNDILNKTDYQSEAMVKALISETVTQLQSSIDLDHPVYYALEGPMVDDNPAATYLFLDIKNQDSLKANLKKNGFEIQDAKTFNLVEDGDMNLAFDKTSAIVLIKPNVSDAKSVLADIYKKSEGEVSTGYIASILNNKSDITFGVNLKNTYTTSNTDLEELGAEKKKEILGMLDNSFVETSVKFENGAIVVDSKNHFSKTLQSKLFLNSDPSAKILSNLGSGHPRVGISLNLDTKRMQEFLNEYAPGAMEELSEDIGGPFAMAMMVANNDISKLIDGRMAAVLVGDLNKVNEGVTPDFNFFIGLAGQGKSFGETIKDIASENFKVVNLTDSGISGFTSEAYAGNGIVLSEASENFGKNAFNMFIDLDGMDLSSMELEGEAKLIELIKYVNITYGNDGGKVVIKAKDGKENALKQVLQKAMRIMQDEIAI